MVEIGKPMLAVYVAAALAIALIGARYLQGAGGGASPGGGETSVVSLAGGGGSSGRGIGGNVKSRGSPAGAFSSERLVLHVTGAVRRPGLVELRDGDRIGDAIRMAGGPARGADLAAVNLAMRVADGQQVVVPARGGVGAAAAGASGGAGPISLNSATAEQLETLDGIGPGLAAKIVAARQAHGGFRSVDDLADVPGIGEKRLESLRAQLQP